MIEQRVLGSVDETSRGFVRQAVVVMLFAAMFLDSVDFPGLGLPISSLAAGCVIVYALAFPQKISASLVHSGRPSWFVLLVVAIPVWLTVTSLLNGSPDIRRLLNIGVYAAVILIISGQRLSASAVGRGLAIAVVAGVAVGTVTLPSSLYLGRMTGPLGDPNSAGYLIVVFTALALPSLQRRKYQIGLVLVAGAGVLLTQSRTSMLALGIMAFWVTLSRFASAWLSVPVVAAVLFWINSASESLVPAAFADRAGSDELRQRIYEVELADVAVSPIIGQGAGTAQVALEGMTFFFHSSYLAIRAEAGWVGLTAVISLLGIVFIRLLAVPRPSRNYFYEAALIGVAVCAINLGEVLLALPAAFAVGLSLRYVVQSRKMAGKQDRADSGGLRRPGSPRGSQT